MLATVLAGAIALSGVTMLRASADESIPADDAIVAEDPDGGESQLQTGGASAAGGALFEDTNNNVQSRDGIKTAGKDGGKNSSKKMIAGYP